MMSFFFGESQIEKMKELVPGASVHEPGSLFADYIAKGLIRCVSANDYKVENGFLIISDGNYTKISRSMYSEGMRRETAKVIKNEIRGILGLDAEVDFFLARTEEWEIDEERKPYCDFTTETMYFYSITIKVKI